MPLKCEGPLKGKGGRKRESDTPCIPTVLGSYSIFKKDQPFHSRPGVSPLKSGGGLGSRDAKGELFFLKRPLPIHAGNGGQMAYTINS